MKTITIRLPDVEVAMFEELRKSGGAYARLGQAIAQAVRQEYGKLLKLGGNR
ncbi:hypothetical protein [Synechococcus sp. MIT S9451]|uniref:hypothetical protein n=1 Tax=Synechococcus sp. MIT S9451 TaxID=3082543 RepID=UPI0039B65BD0